MVQRGHKTATAKRKRREHQDRNTQLTVYSDMFARQSNKVNIMCAVAKHVLQRNVIGHPDLCVIGRVSLARENEAGGSWVQKVHILHVNV